MYLYEKRDNYIYIYSLEPNYERIKEYRMDQLSQIPEQSIFFSAYADIMTPNKILEKVEDEIDIESLNVKRTNLTNIPNILFYHNDYHELKRDSFNKLVLQNYYNGNYVNNKTIKITQTTIRYDNLNIEEQSELDMLRFSLKNGHFNESMSYQKAKETIYYFIITSCYQKHGFSNNMTMENIISVPKSLYLLQLLEQGNIKSIGNENITEQLNLFNFDNNPIRYIPYDHIKCSLKYGLIDDTISNINRKVENSQKILKLLK